MFEGFAENHQACTGLVLPALAPRNTDLNVTPFRGCDGSPSLISLMVSVDVTSGTMFTYDRRQDWLDVSHGSSLSCRPDDRRNSASQIPREKTKHHHHHHRVINNNNNKTTETTTEAGSTVGLQTARQSAPFWQERITLAAIWDWERLILSL